MSPLSIIGGNKSDSSSADIEPFRVLLIGNIYRQSVQIAFVFPSQRVFRVKSMLKANDNSSFDL